MQSRRPYILLLIIYAISRVVYFALGVRFDDRPVMNFFQFIDPELLKHRLLESLWYYHMQPPGFNLYTGLTLKLFPNHYGVVFHGLHLIFGAVICCLLYHLMRVCGVSTGLALGLTSAFMITPGVVLFENFMLYEYLLVFLLMIAAASLYHFFARGRTLYIGVFFTCLFFLVFLRNHFHLIYFLGITAALLWFAPGRRRAIALAALIPFLLSLGLYLKNWFLFGAFASSTWMGMNANVITAHNLTPVEAANLVARGLISPVSLIAAGAPLDAYLAYIEMPPKTGVPVLDDPVTSSGATNFNCAAFFQIQKIYLKDARYIVLHYPRAYLRSVEAAWFAYFLPTSDFPFFDLNRPRIRAFDRWVNIALFGQWKDASNRKNLRRMEEQGSGLGLLLYTGTFLMIALPLLWAWGLWYLWSGVRSGRLNRAAAALLGFMLFNITYITLLSNTLSSFENNRYRFQIDGFFLILAAIAVEQARRRRIARRPKLSPAVFA